LAYSKRQAIELTRSRTGLLAGISVLAVVFTIALTFATLQLPVILGNWLSNYFPDINPVVEPQRVAGLVMGRKRPCVVGSLKGQSV